MIGLLCDLLEEITGCKDGVIIILIAFMIMLFVNMFISVALLSLIGICNDFIEIMIAFILMIIELKVFD